MHMIDSLRPCKKDVQQAKHEALAHAADAAERVTKRMSSPHIRLIVQSADDMREIFRDRRRQ
jgi:hypothetical protein